MGERTDAKCLDCGRAVSVDRWGGFVFYLLRCDQCGRTTTVGFDRLGDLDQRYQKDDEEYELGVEAIAGSCKCGGNYTFKAPPRCPECKSTRIEEGKITLLYD